MYKIGAIYGNDVYTKESENHLPGFYYLFFWKNYLEERNTWELVLIIYHFQRFIIIFHKEYQEKLIATFLLVDSVLSMARPTDRFKASIKWKHG